MWSETWQGFLGCECAGNLGNERKHPAPRRQKTVLAIFKINGGQAYRYQTKSKPSQKHTLEKVTIKEEVPSFGEVGRGFTSAPKIVDKQVKMFQAWLAKQQEQKQTSTPGKASSVVQSTQNKNILPPSLQKPFDYLVQNMTPQIKSSAAISQEMLSQKSNNSDTVSADLLSQKSDTFPADVPTLSENWLWRPQSDDPKDARNPIPFSILL